MCNYQQNLTPEHFHHLKISCLFEVTPHFLTLSHAITNLFSLFRIFTFSEYSIQVKSLQHVIIVLAFGIFLRSTHTAAQYVLCYCWTVFHCVYAPFSLPIYLFMGTGVASIFFFFWLFWMLLLWTSAHNFCIN